MRHPGADTAGRRVRHLPGATRCRQDCAWRAVDGSRVWRRTPPQVRSRRYLIALAPRSLATARSASMCKRARAKCGGRALELEGRYASTPTFGSGIPRHRCDGREHGHGHGRRTFGCARRGEVPCKGAGSRNKARRDHVLACPNRQERRSAPRARRPLRGSTGSCPGEAGEPVTYPDLFNKYRAGLTTGALPDVAEMNVAYLQALVDSRSVVTIEACASTDNYEQSDYVPQAIDAYTLKGVQWAMPWTVTGRVLLYDRNVFRAAGLDPDDPPATLDEVIEDSRRIVERGASRHGIALPTDPGLLPHLYTKSGQLYVNHHNGRTVRATKTLLNSQIGRHIWTWWDDIVESGLGISTGRATTDHLLAVANRDAAMTIDSSNVVGPVFNVLSSGEFAHVDPGVAPLP